MRKYHTALRFSPELEQTSSRMRGETPYLSRLLLPLPQGFTTNQNTETLPVKPQSPVKKDGQVIALCRASKHRFHFLQHPLGFVGASGQGIEVKKQ
jgi:hypothetical protein